MSHSNKAISPLRQRMIEDMTLRRLGTATQLSYIRSVEKFTRGIVTLTIRDKGIG